MSTIGRVTHFTVRNSTLENLQNNLSKMSTLQAQMSSGSKINSASDDPAATADVLRLQGEQRVLAQYGRNADDGEAWLTTVDTALQTSLASVRKARQLTINGGDGALGTTSRIALAQEIEGIRDGLLAQANTTYLGRPVFAGTSAGPAFTEGTYAYNGVTRTPGLPDASVDRTVASGTTIRVDSYGADVYGSGTESIFAVLDEIIGTLRDGGDPTDQLDAIDGHVNKMLAEVSSVGARQNQIDSAQSVISTDQLTSTTRLSAIMDVDLAQIILDLGSQEVAYKGALSAAAKVLQPTLLDFLR